jgi:phosphate-selective porin
MSSQFGNMRITRWIAVLMISAGITHAAFSQSSLPQWNGYIQTRFSSDFDNSSEFSIRRAKIWVYGEVPKLDFISYKIQLNYRSFKDESLMLQDAYAEFNFHSWGKVRAGRFVPDFLLQRMQPDYEIPVLERADVVNSLIHNEKQMARETGLTYLFQNDTLPLHFSVGVFNANVDKPTHSKDNYLLYTSRLVYKIINQKDNWLNIGGSVAYRKLDKSTLTTIYKPDSLISGNDFRWGLEAEWHWNKLELQGEYIQANINHDVASGYYGLANYTFLKKYQAVVLTEKYNDLNPTTNDNAWYGLGLNYLIKGKTKLMVDFKTRQTATKTNYLGEIQLQVFFN